jgi:cytochrome c553
MRIQSIIMTLVFAVGMAVGAVASAQAAEEASSIARGGRLYDKFWGENKLAQPTDDHAAYPNKGGKYGKDASWRCKECHGWDYKGHTGAYGSGGHATGIVGIQGAAGKDPAYVVNLLKGKVHGYTDAQLSAHDMQDLALFVSKGQVDMAKYIDYPTKKAKGDATKGEGYFNTLCANCHGFDGKKINNAPPLGSLQNPQEMLHKVLNGQPGQNMPALRLLDIQISVDLVAHMLTLPQQ